MRTSTLAFVVASAALASAQNSTGVSAQCQAALASVIGSPDAACLNPAGLLGFLAAGTANSVVPGVDTWLKGFCAAASCTNATIAAIVGNITTGCPNELGGLNITPADAEKIFPTFKQVVCLADTSDNELCVTQTLYNVQNATGPLSPANIPQIIESVITGNTSIPSTVICTNCIKEAVEIIQTEQPGLLPQGTNSTLSGTCGASFVDGAAPPTITQTANGFSNPKTTGAASAAGAASLHYDSAITLATSALLAVSGAFLVLA